MTEEKITETPNIDKKEKSKNVVSIGLDVGTMHLVCARSDSEDVGITRNVFLKVNKDDISINQLSNISYVEGVDGELFIVGSDAFEFANIFGTSVLRPMENGLISPKEISAIDVLTLMLKSLIGETKDKDVYCSFSVPAEAVDNERSITYHKNVFAKILNNIGVNHTSVNEAMAIVYSECAKESFSGIAISFGAGMCNCISGDTEIPLLDGSIKTIKELSEHYKNEKFWVYSCKEDGSIVPGVAHSPRKTGTQSVIRIHLDNDTYFDCTEDHPIMMRDGNYTKAGNLKENDSVMPLYLEESKWNEMPGYLSCYNNKHKYWEMVHNMVVREECGIYRKKNNVIHHKNFNRKDNTPENLMQCTKSDHFKFHKEIATMGGLAAGPITRKNRLGKTNSEIYGNKRALEISKKISKAVKNSSSPKTIKEQRTGKTFDEIFSLNISNKIKHKMSEKKLGLTYEEIMKDEESINKRKEQLSTRCSEHKPWLSKKEMINSGTWKKNNVPWNKGLKGEKYKKHFDTGFKNQYSDLNPINHKVIKIERLNSKIDVYDLTVDKYHNFAIKNGIFVHNCAVSYKGIEALTFSTAKSGDWIDKMVAADLDMVPNRVTSIKEKYMKLHGSVDIKNKKTKRVLEALFYYHKALIEYTVKKIIKEFDEKVDIEIDEELPIVLAGGTSLPSGFASLFKNVMSSYELPFEVSEIRRAKNPLTSVANGLLIRTMADVKNIK